MSADAAQVKCGLESQLLLRSCSNELGIAEVLSLCRYVRSLAPNIHPPRWVVSLALNRFLDQDTYLLATQQSVTLSNELRNIADHRFDQQSAQTDTRTADRQQADGAADMSGQGEKAVTEAAAAPATAAAPMARRSWYCHRSPTDNILVASGKWLDRAVPNMPNRYQGLLTSSLQGLSFIFPPALTLLFADDTCCSYIELSWCHAAEHKL